MRKRLTSRMVEVTTKMTIQEARRLPRKTRMVRKMTMRLVTMFCQSSWVSINQLEMLFRVLRQKYYLANDLVSLPV